MVLLPIRQRAAQALGVAVGALGALVLWLPLRIWLGLEHWHFRGNRVPIEVHVVNLVLAGTGASLLAGARALIRWGLRAPADGNHRAAGS